MWWLKNVKIVDSVSGSTQIQDVLIEGERILEITGSLTKDEVQKKD